MRPESSYICQPIRSMQTMLRTIAHQQNTPVTLTPDGVYGPNTVTAVTSFQQQHGLPTTGVTNQETWDTITEAYETAQNDLLPAQAIEPLIDSGTVFTIGSVDPAIMLAQCMLTYIGKKYSCLNTPAVTGILDESTSDALTSFQGLCGLSTTGELNKTTWKHLSLQFPSACFHHNRNI